MIERQATVIAIHDDFMAVRIQAESACSACGQRTRCNPERIVETARLDTASVGEQITLSIKSSALTLSALCAYLLPALTTLAGAQLGEWQGGTSGAGIAGAALGLLAGLAASRWLARRHLAVEIMPQACHASASPIPTVPTRDS